MTKGICFQSDAVPLSGGLEPVLAVHVGGEAVADSRFGVVSELIMSPILLRD